MRLILDAQMPRSLAGRLNELGHDAKHTLELPEGNQTTDTTIAKVADRENRILVTKDSDFVTWHLLHRKPAKLLLVATGNISNADLLRLFADQIEIIEQFFVTSNFVEISRNRIVSHG